MEYSLWDMAGVDGLAVARKSFGDSVGHLAPFQSMETVLAGNACSVLRLCDRNFRIVYRGPLQPLIEPHQGNIWLRQFDWLTRVTLPASALSQITSQATVRPPHRLDPLPNNRAVPAQLLGIPLLIWRHSQQGQSVLELHLANKNAETLASSLERLHSL